MMTVSEEAFREYCEARGYRCRPIPTDTKTTPDFEVDVADNARFVAEVKEFTPNAYDIGQAAELARTRTSGGSFDGRRVRDAIIKAGRQLRRYRDAEIPLILFLYDNIVVDGVRPYARCPYFDPTQIEWAMYGQYIVEMGVSLHPTWIRDRRGGRRQLTHAERNYMSAVAVLAERGEYAWYYHNFFASVPVSRSWLSDERDRHFHNVSDPLSSFPGWSELAVKP
jgi:hypothetical protein